MSSKRAKKKASTLAGDLDIVQLLMQHQERSQTVAGELHQLVTQAAVPTNKSAWATYLHSNLPLVHDSVWPLYLKMLMENYLWALNESDTIRGSERQQLQRQQQQQQPQPLVQLPPPVQLPPHHQLQPSYQLQAPQQLQPSYQLQAPQQQQQYQFTPTPEYSTQVLPVTGPSQVSCSIGGGGRGISEGSSLDVGQMGPATPRNSLVDVSFTTLL